MAPRKGAVRPSVASLSRELAELKALLQGAVVPAAPVAAKLEAAITESASSHERKNRASGKARSVVASAPDGPPTAEDRSRMHVESLVRMYSRTLESPTASSADAAKARRVLARLTAWMGEGFGWVEIERRWSAGDKLPSEILARDERAARIAARKVARAAAPAKSAKSPKLATMTLADFLAAGGTLVAPNGSRISA